MTEYQIIFEIANANDKQETVYFRTENPRKALEKMSEISKELKRVGVRLHKRYSRTADISWYDQTDNSYNRYYLSMKIYPCTSTFKPLNSFFNLFLSVIHRAQLSAISSFIDFFE